MAEAPKLPPPDVAINGYDACYSEHALRAHGAACAREERERCAAAVRALIADHANAPESECLADGSDGCEFIAAWNDAIAAVLSQPEPGAAG